MYTITIKGEAHTNYPNIDELDGIDCQDCFSEYFDGDETYAKDVTGGFMHFEVDKGILMTITRYDSTRELTEQELADLAEYTQGQWSDGIGEGFEQEPCFYTDEEFEDEEGEPTTEVFISPWDRHQVLVTEQIKN